ncbi:hypothetical protein [Streptomyces sp. NPDC047974]|uniref:hypothetical protein n=1 Tax=Streptomyces sp. NPDC047974 TaxID=3154343 RepID=UPI0033D95D40
MANTQNQNTPEPLPQRRALILLAGVVAGAIVLTVASPLAALGAAVAVTLGMRQIVA